MPQDGLHEYVDISAVVNGWQAIVVVVFILAVVWWPSFAAWLSTRSVKKTLTQNNGGSTVKDALDEIKRTQAAHGKKLAEHIDWSEGFVKDTGDRLTRLETRRRRLFA